MSRAGPLLDGADTSEETVEPGETSDQRDEGAAAGREAVPAFVWLFLGALVANIFSGQAATLGLPVSLDRPLFLLALILLVLDPGRRPGRLLPVHAVMALTVVWTVASWWGTGSPTDSGPAFALVDRIMIPFAMFVVGPLVFATPRRRGDLLRAEAPG